MNRIKAIGYYTKSVNLGYNKSIEILTYCYKEWKGVQQNIKKSKELYKKIGATKNKQTKQTNQISSSLNRIYNELYKTREANDNIKESKKCDY